MKSADTLACRDTPDSNDGRAKRLLASAAKHVHQQNHEALHHVSMGQNSPYLDAYTYTLSMKPVEKPIVAKQAIAQTAESLHTKDIACGARTVSVACFNASMV